MSASPPPSATLAQSGLTLQQKIVLASGNPGKIAEFSTLLASANIVVQGQKELGVTEIPEPHVTFVENALAKARHASRSTGLPALADDSGLCVDALGGAPGVHSARYASLRGRPPSDVENNQLLLEELNGISNRQAKFVAILVYLRHADDPTPIICEGIWSGEISTEAHGSGGFGYDPLFYVPELGKTAAQLGSNEKNRYSHRARALEKLLEALSIT